MPVGRPPRERSAERAKPKLSSRICQSHKHQAQQGNRRDHRRLQHIQDGMLADGWCCHQVRHLSNIHHVDTLSYLAKLERPGRRLGFHGRCPQQASCIAYNIDPATYQTGHRVADCNCSMIATPYDDLIRVICQGHIPLISIENDDTGTPQLRVHARSRTSMYMAISHVWIDGLGNPRANALPRCQLEWLHTRLLDLRDLWQGSQSPHLFWMDTLCIPVGPDESFLKVSQIDKMSSIYKGAISSLILDSELMATEVQCKLESTQVDKSPTPGSIVTVTIDTEARARLACSVWMLRSWTYQEGQLPPTVAVQFSNTAVVLGRQSSSNGLYRERARLDSLSLLEDFEETQNGRSTPLSCACVDIALQRSFYSTFCGGASEFVAAWNELAGRSTTMSEDIPLIITNVMDMENHTLRRYDNTYEMLQAIILSLKSVPLSIFFNTGLRQDQDGNHQNRWVPQAVGPDTLTSSGRLSVHPSHLSYIHEDSNESTVSIYTIDGILSLTSEVYLHCEAEGVTYLVEPATSTNDQLDTSPFTSTCVLIENGTSPMNNGKKRGACFYIRNEQDIDPKGASRSWRKLFSVQPLERPTVTVFDLTYNCPLRARQIETWEIPSGDGLMFTANLRQAPSELRITYDPPTGFVRLYQRMEFFVLVRLLWLAIAFAGYVGSFIGLSYIISLRSAYFIGIAVCLAITVFAKVVVFPLTKKFDVWWHVRAFEAIASRQHARGPV